MQKNQLFEYAIIRVVPKVEREEFLNVGVVLFCASRKFLKVLDHLDEKRILSLDKQVDMDEIRSHLAAFELICTGGPGSGEIGKLPLAERFRWLTASRSTVVQSSKVHPGFCTNPDVMLEKLYQEMVL